METLFKGETRSSRRLTDTQFSYSLMIKSSSLTYAAPYTHIRSLFKYHQFQPTSSAVCCPLGTGMMFYSQEWAKNTRTVWPQVPLCFWTRYRSQTQGVNMCMNLRPHFLSDLSRGSRRFFFFFLFLSFWLFYVLEWKKTEKSKDWLPLGNTSVTRDVLITQQLKNISKIAICQY